MSPVGILMIHNPLTSVSGYASELRKAADVLDVVKNTIINAYVLKTGKSRDELSAMMDDEKYMSAGEAMKLGFVDEILEADKKQSGVLNCAFNFDFSRSAILNYGAEDMRKVMERIKQQPPDEPKNEEPETPPVNGGISLPETPDNGEGTQPVADMTALDAQKRRFALNNRKRILTEE